jgi:hypothetical protein
MRCTVLEVLIDIGRRNFAAGILLDQQTVWLGYTATVSMIYEFENKLKQSSARGNLERVQNSSSCLGVRVYLISGFIPLLYRFL